jgi:hypothetical protein
MSLPLQAVDRLFERLIATYGRQFMSLYEGLDINTVKAAWSHELSGFASNLHAVAWALEHLPARAPNAVEFRFLCRLAPAPEVQKLTEPAANPARVRAELAKLGEITKGPAPTSGRDWARRILARLEGGEKVAPATLLFAKQALGLAR